MLWFLVAVLVVGSVAVLGLTVLSTKRHLTRVARDVGGSVAESMHLLEQISRGLPQGPPTCPTCGQTTTDVIAGAPARSR